MAPRCQTSLKGLGGCGRTWHTAAQPNALQTTGPGKPVPGNNKRPDTPISPDSGANGAVVQTTCRPSPLKPLQTTSVYSTKPARVVLNTTAQRLAWLATCMLQTQHHDYEAHCCLSNKQRKRPTTAEHCDLTW